MLLQYPASKKGFTLCCRKEKSVSPKIQITVITAMKKQQGLVKLSDGWDRRAPAQEMCSLHPRSTKIAKSHTGRDPGWSVKVLTKSRRENSSDAALDLRILSLLLQDQVKPKASWREAHRWCFQDGFVSLSHGMILHKLLRKMGIFLTREASLPVRFPGWGGFKSDVGEKE